MKKVPENDLLKQGRAPLAAIAMAVRSLRKALGLTQAELAVRLSLRRNSVSRYELRMMRPSPQVLLLLLHIAREHGQGRAFLRSLHAEEIQLSEALGITAIAPVSGASVPPPLNESGIRGTLDE